MLSKFSLKRKKECIDFIRSHHGAMTQPEMAEQLKIGTTTVTRLINEIGLKQRFYKKRNQNPAIERRSGMFNVNRHLNWLVG